MANFYLSPNMSLVIPTPTVDPGPDWANNLNTSLTLIDSHNHSPGSGVAINPDGISINSNLTFNNNNAVDVRSIRFFPNLTPLALPTDLGAIYEAGVDLYYNDGAGNQIRITQSGSVAGAAGTITGLPSGTASAAYQALSGTFQFQQATATAANIDVATVIIRYPGSYPTPTGNYIALQAPSSLSSGYAITLPGLPPANSTLSFSTTGVIGTISRVTGTTAAIGEVGLSASCGLFINVNAPTNVTNFSVTITTSGRPIMISIVPDGSINTAIITAYANSASSLITSNIAIFRGVTKISNQNLTFVGSSSSTNWSITVPVTTISTTDFMPAGTYTYTVQMSTGFAILATEMHWAKLMVYEL